MKILRTIDGKYVTTCFELDELEKKIRDKAIQDTVEFMSLDRGDDDYVDYEEAVDTVKSNEWLFDFHGNIIPITRYCGKHRLAGSNSIRIFGEERMCIMTEGEHVGVPAQACEYVAEWLMQELDGNDAALFEITGDMIAEAVDAYNGGAR